MSISSILKVIGRGIKGSAHLNHDQAQDVFTQILKGKVTDLELGAFCIAMRIKGESASELMGFMDGLEATDFKPLNTDPHPTIVLPSYNGARKHANLTPLLAALLAKGGFTVIVQGIEKDPARVTSHEIFKVLDWPILETTDDFGRFSDLSLPIFCPLRVLSPALQKFLDLRIELGLRNSGHVLAKLINPCSDQPWQIANYTHPEYPAKLSEYFQRRSANAILMRGAEGEPTASIQRRPEMHFLFKDQHQETTKEDYFNDSNPFETMDAATTALVTHKIIEGQIAAPLSIKTQTQLILEMTGIWGK